MSTLHKELVGGGGPVPFSANSTSTSAASVASTITPPNATMSADVRLRARFDLDNVEVPRGEMTSMVFFERKRRQEKFDTSLLKTRIFDDHTIIQNKQFPAYSPTYRLPIQCTRFACIPKGPTEPGEASKPLLQLAPTQPAKPADSAAWVPYLDVGGAKATKPRL